MMGLPLTTAPMIRRPKQRGRREQNLLDVGYQTPRRRNDVGKEASLEKLRPRRRWSAGLASVGLNCKDWID